MMRALLKPWYVWRPGQIVQRSWNACFPPASGYRTVTTAWGGLLEIDNRQAIGRAIETTGIFDLTVSEFLVRLARPGAQVVDVGGNIGYMSVLLAHRVSTGGKLTTFEPHPELFARLEKNLARNDNRCPLPRLNLRQIALSSNSGMARMVFPEDFSHNDGTAHLARPDQLAEPGIDIQVTTLDDEFPEGIIDVMKLDVEGHEAAVLAGGKNLFAAKRIRHLIFESHEGADTPACRQMLAWGYEILRLGWSLNHPLMAPLNSPEIHRPYESPSFLATIDMPAVIQSCSSPGWQCLRPLAKAS